MLSNELKEENLGVEIRYRYNHSLFDLQKLKSKTRTTHDTVNDLLFADNCALNATSETEMQVIVDKLGLGLLTSSQKHAQTLVLTISTKKTEVMFQPAPGTAYCEPCILINDKKLNAVEKFTYLGSTLSRHITIDAEVGVRIAKASAAFDRLNENL